MLEDSKEETACLHVLGLLGEDEDAEFVRQLATDPVASRAVREFRDSLTNLNLSSTAVRLPPTGAKERLFARVDTEPARVTTDAEGRVVAINPSFTALCGFRLHELRGKKPGHLLQGPDSCSKSVATLREAIHSGSSCEVDMVNYHKDGSPYHVRIQVRPVRDSDGVLTGFEAEERELPATHSGSAG